MILPHATVTSPRNIGRAGRIRSWTGSVLLAALVAVPGPIGAAHAQTDSPWLDERSDIAALRARIDDAKERFDAAPLQMDEANVCIGPFGDTSAFEALQRTTKGEDRLAVLDAFGRALAGGNDAEHARGIELLEANIADGYVPSLLTLAEALSERAAQMDLPPDNERLRQLLGAYVAEPRADRASGLLALADASSAVEAISLRRQALMVLLGDDDPNVRELRQLAEAFWNGLGVRRDRTRAIALVERAVREGSVGAASQLARMLDEVNAPAERRLDAWSRAAQMGATPAIRTLIDDALTGGDLGVTRERARSMASRLANDPLPEAAAEGVMSVLALDIGAAGTRTDGAADGTVDGTAVDGARVDEALARIDDLTELMGPAALRRTGERLAETALPDGVRLPLALDILERAATCGDERAAFLVADVVLADPYSASFFEDREEDRARAVGYLRRAADADVRSAMLLLAEAYIEGRDVPLDLNAAGELLARVVELDPTSPRALEKLGSFILNTRDDRASVVEAISLLRRASALGSDNARTRLGRLLYSGRSGFAARPEEGLAFLRQAAANGYARASVTLGDIALEGTPPDFDGAERRYRDAIEGGDAGGWDGLSRLRLAQGRRDDAIEAARMGAERGDPVAMVNYADLLRASGRADQDEIIAILDEAARLGIDSASGKLAAARAFLASDASGYRQRGLEMLGELGRSGHGASLATLVDYYLAEETLDIDRAVEWGRNAVRRGVARPLITVARALYEGAPNVPRDRERGLALLEDAFTVAPDNVGIAVTLGQAYFDGQGVERDLEKALDYFEEAATRGNVSAQVRTARAYLNGLGTRTDRERGLRWYQQAAALGSTGARLELGRVFASGGGTSLDPELAFVHFYRAAQGGSVAAMSEVGRSLLAGFGIAEDVPAGLEWLERAAEGGSSRAMYDLYNHYSLSSDPAHVPLRRAWLERSAEAGVAEAMFRYAIQRREEGADEAEVTDWLTRAADGGHLFATNVLKNGWGDLSVLRNGYDVGGVDDAATPSTGEDASSGDDEVRLEGAPFRTGPGEGTKDAG